MQNISVNEFSFVTSVLWLKYNSLSSHEKLTKERI